MNTLYIAWQDPQSRLWHTVGRLRREDNGYSFVYTQGALSTPNFKYLGRMLDLHRHYVSRELFPLFANRVLSRSRPDYPDYVRWLGADPKKNNDPLELLARSGGERATDELCVYPDPQVNVEGFCELFFFSHGLRYLNEAELQSLGNLKIGDRLSLVPEDGNIKDSFALRLENGEAIKMGYCPRYLNKDLREVLANTHIDVSVARLNLDAPAQFRLLCHAKFVLPAGITLFGGEEYLPLSPVAKAA
ncbi:HIRAN domain-containing protein [Methylomonas rhizoryzae]|uniref:HIRAN domain-containing protein n=1 Tax=Methylomonas rhizoryzae TaxID=2608981 RepID=UPI001232BF09|nr:HIRAN domain-containing protein [Methylomonas rhizoryzae]